MKVQTLGAFYYAISTNIQCKIQNSIVNIGDKFTVFQLACNQKYVFLESLEMSITALAPQNDHCAFRPIGVYIQLAINISYETNKKVAFQLQYAALARRSVHSDSQLIAPALHIGISGYCGQMCVRMCVVQSRVGITQCVAGHRPQILERLDRGSGTAHYSRQSGLPIAFSKSLEGSLIKMKSTAPAPVDTAVKRS